MRITVIGPGRIGGNAARLLARAGHEVSVSFSRDPARLAAVAAELGPGVAAAPVTPDSVASADVVVLSVPWSAIPEALAAAGPLAGKVVLDTTNQFGSGQMPAPGQTAAQFNAARMGGARYVKSLNTLTAAFQATAAQRRESARVVQWVCGDDPEAKAIVAGLLTDCGYVPVDLGATADAAPMEAPRRAGALYGEEYRRADAEAALAALRAGRRLPPTPHYAADE